MAADLPDEELDEPEQEQETRVPMRTVPADGRTVDEPFEAPADVASHWDFRDWRRV